MLAELAEVDTLFESSPVPMVGSLLHEVIVDSISECFVEALEVRVVFPGLRLLPLPPFGAYPVIWLSRLPPNSGEVGNDSGDRAFNGPPNNPRAGKVGNDKTPGRVPAIPEGSAEGGFPVPDS